MYSTDSLGDYTKFEKPLSTTWVMFLAMSLSFPFYMISQLFLNEKDRFVIDEKFF